MHCMALDLVLYRSKWNFFSKCLSIARAGMFHFKCSNWSQTDMDQCLYPPSNGNHRLETHTGTSLVYIQTISCPTAVLRLTIVFLLPLFGRYKATITWANQSTAIIIVVWLAHGAVVYHIVGNFCELVENTIFAEKIFHGLLTCVVNGHHTPNFAEKTATKPWNLQSKVSHCTVSLFNHWLLDISYQECIRTGGYID